MAMFRTLISAAVLLATVICLGTAHEELLQSLDDVESLEESSPLSRINLNKVWDNEQNEAALDNGDDTFLLEERGTGEAPAAPKEAAPTEKAAPAAPKKAAPAAPKKAAPAAPKKAAPAAPKKAAPAAPKKAAPASPTKAAPVAPTKAAPVAPTKAAAAASPTKAAPVAPTKAAPVAPTKAAPAGAAPEAAKPAPTADAPKGETPTAEGKGNAPAAGGDTALPGLVKNLVKLKTDVDKIQGSNWMKILEDHRDGVVQIMVVKKKFLWKAAYRSPLSVEVSGSGWFIDNSEFSVDTKNQMLVVTNAHVAKNAAEINILIPSLGQEPVPVEVVGLCSQRDIAILRVENPAKLLSMYKAKTGKDSITKMKLGDSDKMKRGANCMAVGYPLGLKSVKASMGIVSGYQQFHSALYLQITAPINPGNSGGPLFNDEGQVVGINSAKIAQASGMSFSIASVQLKVMLDVLYERREFVVPFLGYKFSVGTKLLHKYLHVQGDTLQQGGIYITNVQPQGLFVKAGVKRGDLLVTVDGANIDRFGQAWMPTMKDNINILGLLARKKVGTFLVLGVWRAKEKKMLSLSVQYDSTDPFAIPYIYEPILNIPKFEIFAGVVLMELSLNMVSVLLPQNVAGLIKYTLPENRMKPRIVIAGVIPGSLAALDGSIKAGLLVDTINSKEVSAMADVCTVLSQKPKEWWTISTRETFTAFKVEQVDLFEKEDAPNKHAACAKQAKPTPATGSQFESDLNMLL